VGGEYGAVCRPILLIGIFLRFLFGFFLFQANLVFTDEGTQFGIVVLLAVQRIV
jgi:hypothetical protein